MSAVEHLRELIAAASPGPWWHEQQDPEYRPADPYDLVYETNGAWDFLGETHSREDAELIVAAVNAMPGLLNALERLRAENDMLHAQLDEVKQQRDTYAALR